MVWYRVLLWTLPGWFREEFGSEMAGDFRESLADARRQGGAAPAALWWATVRDVLALAGRLHLDSGRQDLSYAARTLKRTPALTTALIATLAVGMGPLVIIANLLQQVVIAPLPWPQPDRLVSVWQARPERNGREFPFSTPDYVDLRDSQRVFDALAAHAGTSAAIIGGGEPRQITGVLATAELFRVLQITPLLGRPLTRADSAPDAPAVIVLGEDFWRSEFAARPDILGTTLRLDGVPTEIVGVIPAVDFPNGSRNFWVPLTVSATGGSRGSRFLNLTGRLAAGVSLAQARDVLNGIASGLAEKYPATNAGYGVDVVGLKEQLNGEAPRILVVLTVAIAAVFLIACTNVAGLLAVRSSLRQSELAVRTAIGASIRRLRRQLLLEHVLLASCGALVALGIAVPLHRLVVEERLLALPRTASPQLAWPAFALLGAVVMTIAALFARVAARRPAIAASASALLGAARQTGTRAQLRGRRALVVVEIAGALALVAVAGLMIRSAARLASVDPGFRTEQVLTFSVALPGSQYPQPADRVQFVDRVLEQVRRLPGVQAAASAAYAPMGAMRATRRFAPADRPMPPLGSETLALDMPAGVGYFEVMGIRVIAGRSFDERDSADARPVVIVSETFAREHFAGQPAVGKMIAFYPSSPGATPPPAREIVGVVSDVRQDAVRSRPMAHMYTPYAQTPWGFTSFFVRTSGDPDAVAGSLQRAVSRVDPARPIRDVKTTAEIVSDSTARTRAITWMLTALAAIAMLLATIGLYGVSAAAAAARARELAIRAAVGAEPAALMRLMLTQGVLTGVVGVLAGAGAGLVAARGLEALLFETAPRDPVIFASTALLLLAMATCATYLPARRALRANPADVLRTE